jgi:uncharacterized protein
MVFARLQWDEGNWPKCGKHGVSKEEIEQVFRNDPMTSLDPFSGEQRFRAVGRTDEGRYVFVVFAIRRIEAIDLIRPISARFMHGREIRRYE